MKNKNRFIAFILSVMIIISMIPASVFGADGTIEYSIEKPKMGIMNRINSENNLFRKTYLRAADDNFNLAYKFNRTSANNVNGANEKLSYNTSMMHKKNGDYWKAYYEWVYQKRENVTIGAYTYVINKPTAGNEGIADLISAGQIKVDLSADLTADKHWNAFRHDKKIVDRAYASLSHTDEKGKYSFMSIVSDRDAPDESAVNFREVKELRYSSHLAFELYFTGLGCECGSSKVSRVSVGLIDDINPTIKSIYASRDKDGKQRELNGFKAGDTGYLNLTFNENIRFANDSIPSEAVLLNLTINGAVNNVEITTNEITARLVKLSGNKMIFKFEVPAQIAGENTNVYISGISKTQAWVKNLGQDDSFPLVLFGKDGAKITLNQSLSNMKDLTHTSSLVTDMAGNPINWQGSSKNLSELCFLDNVAPVVKGVEIQGARISAESNQSSQSEDWPKDIDRSTVFAGVGDKLVYSVRFNEEMRVPKDKLNEVIATLNASYENGGEVTLKAKEIVSIADGVNGIKVSKIIFETLNISVNMIPDGTGEPLKIKEIKFPSGTEDLRQNKMNNLKNEQGNIVITAPAQQQFLDTQLPVASTTITKSEGKYSPAYYVGGDNKKEFYFPVNTQDVDNIDTLGKNYASGVNGVEGSFAWLDESPKESYPFEYYISASQNKPSESLYKEAMTSSNANNLNAVPFIQIETGNYIHIKLKDNVRYNINESKIIIMPKDYAQNKGKNEFNLNFSADYVPPEIIKIGEKNNFDITDGGTIELILSIKDLSGINPSNVEYQWVQKGDEPSQGAWLSDITVIDSNSTALKISIKKNDLAGDETHEYDLLIRAEDMKGNKSDKAHRVSCTYDLKKSNPNLEIKSETDRPTGDIVIGMELQPYSGSDSNLEDFPSQSILMIKNPETEDNEYFVTILSSHIPSNLGSNADSFVTNDLFDDIKEAYRTWYSAKITRENDGSFSFSDSEKLESYDTKKRIVNSIINHEDEFVNAYYGNVDLIFVTAYGNIPDMFNLYMMSRPGNAPYYFEIENGQLGEHTPFYLDGVDGIYFVEHSTPNMTFDHEKTFYYKYNEKGDLGGTTTPSAINGKAYEIVDVGLPITRISGNINVQEYRLMLAPKKYKLSMDTIGVDFGNITQADGTQGLLWNESYVLGGVAQYLKNLDGAKIKFTLKNLVESSWGVIDMDFESDDTYVALYYTEHGVDPHYGNFLKKGYNGGPLEPLYFSDGGRYEDISELTPLIKIKPIATDKEQSFVIPNNLTEKTGFYALEVSIKPMNSDNVEKKYFVDMFVDGSKSVGNGISYFNVSISESYDQYILYKYIEVNSNDMLLGTSSQAGYKIDRSMSLDINHVKPVEPVDQSGSVYPLAYYRLNEENQRIISTHYPDTSSLSGIKIWNAASSEDGNAPDYLQWNDSSSIYGIKFNIVNNVNELKTAASYVDEQGEFALPVTKDGNNIICYQLIRSNGYVSPMMQFNVSTSSIAPEFNLKLDSDNTQAWVSSVTANAENVVSPNGIREFGCVAMEFVEEGSLKPITIEINNEYYFYIMDNAGNISLTKKLIDWVDSEIPEVSVIDNNSGASNEFKATVTIRDNQDLTNSKLYLSFDKEYSNLLNCKNDELSGEAGITDEFVSVEIPLASGGIGEWLAKDAGENYAGIYRTNTVLSEDKLTKTVEIWGAFKYDDETAEGFSVSRRLSFTSSDQAGNFSKAYETDYYVDENGDWKEHILNDPVEGTYLDISTKNIKPVLKTKSMTADDKVKLEFSAPVLVTSPLNSNPAFGKYTDSLAVYNDGMCSIVYRDLFGKEYSVDENINLFGRFNAVIKLSETKETQDDINIFAVLPTGSDVEITGITGIKNDSSSINGEISEDKKSASLIMNDNGEIKLYMKADDGETKERIIIISNIDRKIETVTPYIYYTGGKPSDGQSDTDGAVVIGIQCDELLTGTNGPLTHTFTNGAKLGDSYTFEYEDMAKNKGSYTFILDHNVVYDIPDTSAPEFSVVLYSKLDYMNNQSDSFTESLSLGDAIKALPKSQGYMLIFNIFDESKVKLIVKSGDEVPSYADLSDSIDGITVTDRSITIDKNCEFKAYLVDEKENITPLYEMSFDKIDTTSPTATVEYSASTFYSTAGYLIPSEDIIITNIAGVKKADSGLYQDKYYHEYEQNETFVFYYKDEVGNTGQTEANVDWLDVNPPQMISLKWTPSKSAQDKENGIYPPPSEYTNKDVVAQLEFNKTVMEIKAYYKDTDNEVESSKVKISFIQNGATVTYTENVDLDLYFKSSNGKSARVSLGELSCIDKIKPVISHSSILSTDKQSEEFTFTSNELVYMAEDLQSNEKEFKNEFKYRFTANGSYDMHFTDKAGNAVVYKLSVKNLDKELMKVYFNTESSDTGAVDSASKLNMDGKSEFYVKLSKNGKIIYDGTTKTASKNEWVKFDFTIATDKVLYMIEAIDDVIGTKIHSYIGIELPDKIPPSIILPTPMISVKEGSSKADVEARLNKGVVVSDNKDTDLSAIINSVSTEDGTIVQIGDNMPVGKYKIEYKAIDKAGNVSLIYRTLRIYDKYSINAMINGEAAEPWGTMVLNTQQIMLNIENLLSTNGITEPCKVYYKAGLMTVGQMKIRASKLETDSFDLPGTGFYTIYIQAQDRKDYITYIYIER